MIVDTPGPVPAMPAVPLLKLKSLENTIDSLPREIPDKDEPEEYLLRWSEHNPQLIGCFHQMWQDEHLTDATLATETKTFEAHKLILSACSPYFRNLFMNNPCKHPIVFLRDIPESHMWLLLEYMYKGTISVEQKELSEILKTASSLQIRGFSSQEPPQSDISDTPRPLIVDEQYPITEVDNFQHVETSSSHSSGKSGRAGVGQRKAEGRKSSMPKKLRLSGDSDNSSARCTSSISEELIKQVENESPSEEEEQDIEINQPVDFSTNKIDSAKYSILGSYLKSGRTSSSSEEERQYDQLPRVEISEDLRHAGLVRNWFDPLSALPGPRPASRNSSGDSREDQDTSVEDNLSIDKELKEHPQINLPESMGIDIAERLRSHFLANIPSPSYAWLNGMNGLAPANTASSVIDNVKLEKHPMGGIKTGEIGPNGKPAVKCEECGKTLADPSSLYRHRKIHTGDKPHKCPYCPRRFIQRYNMKQHIKTHRIELLTDHKPENTVLSTENEILASPKLPSINSDKENGVNMSN